MQCAQRPWVCSGSAADENWVVRKGGQDYFLAVGEGFVEITGERVAIMTDMAIKAENIDEAKAEEARRRAEVRLSEKLSDEESAMVSAALAHSLAQLKVKRRQRRAPIPATWGCTASGGDEATKP